MTWLDQVRDFVRGWDGISFVFDGTLDFDFNLDLHNTNFWIESLCFLIKSDERVLDGSIRQVILTTLEEKELRFPTHPRLPI